MRHLTLVLAGVLAMAVVSVSRVAKAGDPPTELWTDVWDGPGGHNDYAYLAAFDPSGAIYVAGSTYEIGIGGDSENFFLRRYSASGSVDWTVFHGGLGYDAPSEMRITSSGDVAVTGFSKDGGQTAVATIVYDDMGSIVWDEFVTISGTVQAEEYPPSIVEDSSGNLIVAVTSNDDYLVLKYSPAGSLLWSQTFDGPTGGPDFCSDVAVDAMDNVYVTGIVHSAVDFAQAAVTVKYDASGTFQWDQTETGVFGAFFTFGAIDVASDGDIVVAANPESSCGVFQARIWKLAALDGSLQWLESFPPEPCDSVEPTDMRIAPDGSVVLTGFGTIDFAGIHFQTIRYAPDGQFQWHREYAGPGPGGSMASSLVLDAAGNSYVAGLTTFLPQNRDHAAVKYSPTGELEWELLWSNVQSTNDDAMGIAVSAGGNVLLAGRGFDPDQQYDATALVYQQASPTAADPATGFRSLSLQAIPNPFNPSTSIHFVLPESGPMELSIYDLAGRRVSTLVRGFREAGKHEFVWRGLDDRGLRLASGMYFCQLNVGAYRTTQRVTLLK